MTSEVRRQPRVCSMDRKMRPQESRNGRTPVDKTASAEEQKRPPGTDTRAVADEKRIHASLRPLSTLLLAVLVLQGCNALNPLCEAPAPPRPFLSLGHHHHRRAGAAGILLTVNGSRVRSSSVVVINGTTLSTKVLSSSQLPVTITTAFISAPGTASVTVSTPSGNSGSLGCTSGGTSQARTLTIT